MYIFFILPIIVYEQNCLDTLFIDDCLQSTNCGYSTNNMICNKCALLQQDDCNNYDGCQYIKKTNLCKKNIVYANTYTEITSESNNNVIANRKYENTDLSYVFFNNITLHNVDFINVNLQNSEFKNMQIINSIFNNVNIQEAIFVDSKLSNVKFTSFDFETVSFKNTYFDDIILTKLPIARRLENDDADNLYPEDNLPINDTITCNLDCDVYSVCQFINDDMQCQCKEGYVGDGDICINDIIFMIICILATCCIICLINCMYLYSCKSNQTTSYVPSINEKDKTNFVTKQI